MKQFIFPALNLALNLAPNLALFLALGLTLTGCAEPQPDFQPFESHGAEGQTDRRYLGTVDHGHRVRAVPAKYAAPGKVRQVVRYAAPHPAGTIVVDPGEARLYHILPGGKAMRYTAGTGAASLAFSGEAEVARIAHWPRWTPTPDMLRRDPQTYGAVSGGLPGGAENPLGARALYLYQNGRDTLYRIHGTPAPWSVGTATTSGCIRLFDQDVIHLAAQVRPGTRVIVLPRNQAGRWTR